MSAVLYTHEVIWPDLQEWRRFRNRLQHPYQTCVAIMEETPFRIQRLYYGDLQRLYYNGHRRTHVINSQMIIDHDKIIRHCTTCFLGHINCARTYRLVERSGYGDVVLPLPPNCLVAVDRGYPDDPHLLRDVLHDFDVGLLTRVWSLVLIYLRPSVSPRTSENQTCVRGIESVQGIWNT